jgi:hypothetical protein
MLETERNLVDTLAKTLSEELGFSESKNVINRILKILVKDFDVQEDHFKFDYSFSLIEGRKDLKNLRFTYNNFGEKNNFDKKIIKIFNLFRDKYNTKRLKKILKLVDVNGKHQTTFGIDWPSEDLPPRLKIYLEELYVNNNVKERIEKVKSVSNILKMPSDKILGTLQDFKISVIGIDFFPNGENSLKIYNYSKELELEKYAECMLKFQMKRIQNFFKHFDLEKSSFFQIAYRFNSDASLKSFKILKIYESFIRDFTKSDKEVEILLKKTKLLKYRKLLKNMNSIASRFGMYTYPCIISTDQPKMRSDKWKADLHFSIRKN